MPVTIYLEKFLKEGKFGHIMLGTHENVVLDFLGKPDSIWLSSPYRILYYQGYEITTYEEDSTVIGIQHDNMRFEALDIEHAHFRVDSGFLGRGNNVTFSQVWDWLEAEAIPFTIERYNFKGALDYFKLESGVTLDFTDEIPERRWDPVVRERRWMDKVIEDPGDYVLTGIRLYNFA